MGRRHLAEDGARLLLLPGTPVSQRFLQTCAAKGQLSCAYSLHPFQSRTRHGFSHTVFLASGGLHFNHLACNS